MLAGKVIVVTGSASGLGRATAARLAERGATVAGFDRAGDPPGDVTDAAAVDAFVAGVVARHGRLDGLATFAGIELGGGIEAVCADDWRRVLEVNVVGTANAVRAGMPHLVATRGAVVLCSSQLSLSGAAGCVAYAASKGAINAMARALALDHAAEGVRVNAVAPGATETPMMARAFAGLDAADVARALAHHPLGRFGQPADTAAAAAFLLSDEAAFITGVVLPVDGGWTAA